MSRDPKPPRVVREPLQVYLTGEERGFLDAVADKTGLSRAEILRRGMRRFGAEALGSVHPGVALLNELASDWPADSPSNVAAKHDDYLADAYSGRRSKKK